MLFQKCFDISKPRVGNRRRLISIESYGMILSLKTVFMHVHPRLQQLTNYALRQFYLLGCLLEYQVCSEQHLLGGK